MKKKQKKENLEQELENFKDLLQRVQADFINYKKRIEEEKKSFVDFAAQDFVLKVLPILDNLNRAFKHLPKNFKNQEWVLGIRQIKRQFEDILEKEGVRRIATKGKEFDHHFHEIVLAEENPQFKSGQIIEEIEPGYIMKDKVVRPAKVKIAN